MTFDERGENAGRRERRAAARPSWIDELDTRAAGGQLVRDGAADDACADYGDVH
jgi:hypothetical protein